MAQQSRSTMPKVFNDPIHGHIELHPLLVCIIDTPQFQRLRFIKQMGASYFVYPGAAHNRFEHSIGVAHLAGKLVNMLRERQPELGIDDRDSLCVQIAGLCHDLGHGPFSHLFDGMFMPKARPDTPCKHEILSIEMFNHMVCENPLKPVMEKYGLILEEDLVFIKALIHRENTKEYPGRTPAKSFLFDIVSNKSNGVDVDKWDYLARDTYHLGFSRNFDHRRFLKFVRVCKVDGMMLICTRDKEAGNLYDMFYTRNAIQCRVYHHRVKDIIENMITDALLKADEHLNISGAILDMKKYTILADCIFMTILRSSDPSLKNSRDTLQRILRRDLYKCVGETKPLKDKKKAEEIILILIKNGIQNDDDPDGDYIVRVIDLNYGKEEKNPIEDMYFYRKEQPDKAVKIEQHEVSHILPKTFLEQIVRVYSRKTDEKTVVRAKMVFQRSIEEFKERHGMAEAQ